MILPVPNPNCTRSSSYVDAARRMCVFAYYFPEEDLGGQEKPGGGL